MKDLLWAIPLFPLAGFLVNGFLYLRLAPDERGGRPRPRPQRAQPEPPRAPRTRPTRTAATGDDPLQDRPHDRRNRHRSRSRASSRSARSSTWGSRPSPPGRVHTVTLYRWIPLGVNEAVGQVPGRAGEWFVDAAFRLDSLSALMIAFVTFVGFLIHVYSVGYMGHDDGYGRYFAYLNLFMFAMLVLVLAEQLPAPLRRVGGRGPLLVPPDRLRLPEELRGRRRQEGLRRQPDRRLRLHPRHLRRLRALRHARLRQGLHRGGGGPGPVRAVSDARLPLPLRRRLRQVGAVPAPRLAARRDGRPHARLGPDPRRHDGDGRRLHGGALQRPLPPGAPAPWWSSPSSAASRRVFAATIGLVQNDIKKVLAYSTVSQLGYMFLACGVGAFVAGIFHVMTHAFFKACLFLGSGSVIHALSGEQDIRRMGGLEGQDPDDLQDVPRRDARDLGRPALRRFLLEGRDPRRGLRGAARGLPLASESALGRGPRDGGPDRVLHVPPRFADVLSARTGGRRSRRRTSTSRRAR